ncbi:MAG: EF-hand domain-containing protein [Caulobacteraceae bacterium]
MKTLIVSGLALGLALSAAPAFAKGGADVNKDGRVTLQEAQQKVAKRFALRDRDHDGRLTPAEFSAARAHKAGKHSGPGMRPMKIRANRFAKLDLNRDGFVTLDEMQMKVAKRFAKHDRDRDGANPVRAHRGRVAG